MEDRHRIAGGERYSKMRIRNLSSIRLPRQLWRALAEEMGLASVLPLAVTDKYGLYDDRRSLRVLVNRQSLRRVVPAEIVVGEYTLGRISLFPCPKCTAGFLTFVFLHELCHAWLHQNHEALYEEFESCLMCDSFAEKGYRIIGGRSSSIKKCWTFELSVKTAIESISEFHRFAESFISADQSAIRKRLGHKVRLSVSSV
jgi:hypothetical protein